MIDGARSIISSAYANIKRPQRGIAKVLRLSIYIANNTGESTEPCLTTKVTVNMDEKKPSHLTHEKHSEKRLIIISNNWTGIFLLSGQICHLLSVILDRYISAISSPIYNGAGK